MGKILIIRGATYTPGSGGGSSNTGSSNTGSSNTGSSQTVLSDFEAYFQVGKGVYLTTNTLQSYANRAVLWQIPVSSFFPNGKITISTCSGADYSLSIANSAGKLSNIGGESWNSAQGTYDIPSEAVYINVNLRFNDNSDTAGSTMYDFVESIKG